MYGKFCFNEKQKKKDEVFIKRKILSVETILRTHTQPRTHAGTNKQTNKQATAHTNILTIQNLIYTA